MIEMKKLLTIVLAILVAVSLAACGSAGGGAETEHSEPDPQANDSTGTGMNDANVKEEAPSSTDPGNAAASGSKVLVVYFSASGNTRRVAELAADELGADTFEIVPAEPYSEDDLNWRDRNSRVCREHDDMSLQDIELISAEAPDWSRYDTVLFGYPLWWREAPWVVNRFVQSNDFTGKTVIPFCTSTSNGLGDSGVHLAEMAGSGAWLDGIRFSENPSESSVREWAHSLGLK